MFTGDTTIARLISVYWDDVEQLAVWCIKNNLVQNATKTMELILDFRWKKMDTEPLFMVWTVQRGSQNSVFSVFTYRTWSINTL